MSVAKQKNLISKVAQKIFEEATASSLGSTFHVIICFHLKQKFGKDPYEVFTESPKTFYDGLKEVLGEGARAFFSRTFPFFSVLACLLWACFLKASKGMLSVTTRIPRGMVSVAIKFSG